MLELKPFSSCTVGIPSCSRSWFWDRPAGTRVTSLISDLTPTSLSEARYRGQAAVTGLLSGYIVKD
ncbi:hypothetical protein J6590_016317 [Homalodisca vitripennis]|nr:hypothetical protein J6590_016317 [Homalodisca vitripennis]